MEKRDIALLRLRSQRLSQTELNTPAQVVGWLGCVQSQDYAPGKWSVGQRGVGLSDQGLDEALADGRILRTHILRPTWHFVLPQDVRWIQALTAPRVKVLSGYRRGAWGVDEALMRTASRVFEKELTGQRRTRKQLQQALVAGGIEAPEGPRLAYIFMVAELDCLITSGGLEGKQQTYALLDEVVAPTPVKDPPDALAEFTRRYFLSHGPAAIADLTWWSSLTVAEAKRGLEMVGKDLEKRTIDGLDYWAESFDVPIGPPEPRAIFTQGLDEYFVGYQKTRGAVDTYGIGPKDFNVGFYHALVVDGQVRGVVRRVVDKTGVEFQTRIPRALTADEQAEVDAASDRYATFLDSEVRVKMVA